MATLTNPGDGASISSNPLATGGVKPTVKATPDNYTTLGELVDDYAKPDNRDLLIKTYGDQGITGFLKLTGAVNAAATQDEVQYWEEGRRHALATVVSGGAASGDQWGITVGAVQPLRDNDVVMATASGRRYYVKRTSEASTEGTTNFAATLFTLDGGEDASVNDTELIVLGNLYEQGSAQPSSFMDPDLVKRINPFMIVKERYQVNGSQATNIGWVNIGGGEYRWFMKGEQEARARFNDQREMMMLFAQSGLASDLGRDIHGSEGYFAAVEDRGIVVSNAQASPLDSIAEFDDIILELDKEGAPAEYAMYLNRKQSLAIDDMLASGISTNVTAGLAGQFGAFNNDSDLAVQLGFKSFTRGGYTFHKHDWKLLNDPTLLGASNEFQGAMVPMTTVVDPRSGNRAPALEMNYKAANGYSRELEHWVTGGHVMGHANNGDDGKDVATFHYRSEINLITRAANQHVAIKG